MKQCLPSELLLDLLRYNLIFFQVVLSTHGLLTTVAYQLGKDQPVCYALEGSVAIAGAAVRWLRDNLGIIKSSEEIGEIQGLGLGMSRVGFSATEYSSVENRPDIE